MSDIAQLKPKLKALKLSGAVDTLELRLMEAEQNELSYSELLLMILNDELDLRSNRRLKMLLTKARLENDKTLESFDFSFNHTINAAQIRELALCRFIDKGENVFFIGPTGTGKTHLSKALAHMACRRSMTVEFFVFRKFFEHLHNADLSGRLDKALKTVIRADLVVFDEFAFKPIDQKSAELFYSVIDARYGVKSTILTSNRSMSDWAGFFPDPIMANAIMDRLCHNAHQIVIKGESYRRKNRPEKLTA
ncbi:MAG: IS21-like element helper ATPase IstB [Methanococcaceae archaeon]